MKQAEEAIVSSFNETELDGGGKEEGTVEEQPIFSVKNALWHGGSAYDAWFSCASNQVSTFLISRLPTIGLPVRFIVFYILHLS